LTRTAARRSFAAVATLALGPALADSVDRDVPEPVEVCLSCHAYQPDEPQLEGPTLWQVVGRPIAGVDGFDYSEALRRQQGYWDRETLDRFLSEPQAFAPGIQMTFGGVRNAADRKVVLDFLETLRAEGVAPAPDASAAGKESN
jgi:cytochrome c